jgi:4-amino-4-deoxy-L-arabinose transferase-like glycosyltransferase
MKKTDWLATLALILLRAITFVKLRDFPIFVDESIATWWIWRATAFGEWLRPMRDGKPMEAWPVIPFVKPGFDWLTTMRALHVTAGVISVVLVYWLAVRFASQRAAFIAALLVALCPFTVFFSRLSVPEIYLCMGSLLTLTGIVYFWHTPTWTAALVSAVGMVTAAISKLPVGFVMMAAGPLAVAFMPQSDRKRMVSTEARFKWIMMYLPVSLLLVAGVIVVIVQVRMGQAPGFGVGQIMEKAAPTSQTAKPLANLPQFIQMAITEWQWPIVAFAIVGLIVSLVKGNAHSRWLAVMGLLPMAGILFVAGLWFSRYFLFTLPPLVISAVSGWERWLPALRPRLRVSIAAGVLTICLMVMGLESGRIIFAPLSSALGRGNGAGWASGFGFPELANYIQQANPPPIIYTLEVGTAMQLRAYVPQEWTDRIQELQIVDGQVLNYDERYAYLLSHTPAWLVTSAPLDSQNDFVARHLYLFATFDRPYESEKVALYEVIP